jgi:hypothetical protein
MNSTNSKRSTWLSPSEPMAVKPKQVIVGLGALLLLGAAAGGGGGSSSSATVKKPSTLAGYVALSNAKRQTLLGPYWAVETSHVTMPSDVDMAVFQGMAAEMLDLLYPLPNSVTWPEAVLADSLNSLQQNALDKTAAALTALHAATYTSLGGSSSSPGSPPNVSGDPAGYNSGLWSDPRPVRQALAVLGYSIELGLTNPIPSGVATKFQRDWNTVANAIWSGLIARPGGPGPWPAALRGVLDPDGSAGKATHNAIEIAYRNQGQNSLVWQQIVQQAKAAGASDAGPGPGGARRALLEKYLDAAEAVSGIVGLKRFALVASLRESNWNPNAANTSVREAGYACAGFNKAKATLFKSSPYRNEPERWCWGSGGWFGFLPSSALGRAGFYNLDPYSVKDPASSVAYITAFVHSIIKTFLPKLPADQRNWLAVRRAMASLTTMYDWQENGETAKKVRARLAEFAVKAGVDPDFMFDIPPISQTYPGNANMLAAMKAVS